LALEALQKIESEEELGDKGVALFFRNNVKKHTTTCANLAQ
jgi:hypothetical protein